MQKTITKLTLAVPVLVLALAALVTVPAFAARGSADTNDTSTSSNSGSGSDDGTDDNSGSNSTETETEHVDSTELRHRGSRLVAELRKEQRTVKTAEERTKTCESRRKGLETKFARIVANSKKLETKIGVFQTRATEYQTENNVTVDGWDGLVTKANDAKTAVDESIADLEALDPTVDCESTTVAEQVATFKATAQQVKTDLKAYKTAVKNLFVALQNAKEDTGDDTNTTTTEGGNQ
jgi:chromosome segregation ATPase